MHKGDIVFTAVLVMLVLRELCDSYPNRFTQDLTRLLLPALLSLLMVIVYLVADQMLTILS